MIVTLLLVEDDDDLRPVLAEALRGDGYQVIEARHELEARAVVDGCARLDLLLTDVEMPGGQEGLYLARHLRETDSVIPIIVMSGKQLDQMDLPADAVFLFKPFGVADLLRSVAAMLRVAKETRQAYQSENEENGDVAQIQIALTQTGLL